MNPGEVLLGSFGQSANQLDMAPFLEFTVMGNPRVKERPRVMRGYTYTPKDTAGAELVIAWEAKAALNGRRAATGPLILEARFFMGTARHVDSDNLLKLLLDSGNGVVWADDSQITEMHVYRALDRERPRTEVRVWEA